MKMSLKESARNYIKEFIISETQKEPHRRVKTVLRKARCSLYSPVGF